ncbi:MAG: hypothetical protein ACC633_03215, partial [Anaerolineales bacterium]
INLTLHLMPSFGYLEVCLGLKMNGFNPIMTQGVKLEWSGRSNGTTVCTSFNHFIGSQRIQL